MNPLRPIRAVMLTVALLVAVVAACTQGPGGVATDAPAASPSPPSASDAPSASPSSSGGKIDYGY